MENNQKIVSIVFVLSVSINSWEYSIKKLMF